MNATERLKLLLDPERLAVAGSLAVAASSTDDLVESTGIEQRRVLEAIGELRAAAFVVDDAGTHRLDVAELRSVAAQLVDPDLPMDPTIGFGMTDEERAVLARYFEGRTLVSVPTSRAKRLVILERLALEFDVGQKYSEEAVNSVLGAFNPD
ncbi:MAG: DUF2087 domain-containing protein, partial [Ilumatobacter sp.]